MTRASQERLASGGASPADDSAGSDHLRQHVERSGRALGSKRLSVRLIDYEVLHRPMPDCVSWPMLFADMLSRWCMLHATIAQHTCALQKHETCFEKAE